MKVVIHNCRVSIRPSLSMIAHCSFGTLRDVRKIIRDAGYWDDSKDTTKKLDVFHADISDSVWQTYKAFRGINRAAATLMLLDNAARSYQEEDTLLKYLLQKGILKLYLDWDTEGSFWIDPE